jgi:hypothetical protein
MVYAPERKPSTEGDKFKPWLKLAKAKLEAEQELPKIPGLNLVILRLAFHGEGAVSCKSISRTTARAEMTMD